VGRPALEVADILRDHGAAWREANRVAISNSRLIAADASSVTFKVKDYRVEGPGRYTSMTLEVAEFIRRFLLHVLPKGFHRIRHYGLLAGTAKEEAIAKARDILITRVNPYTAEIDEDVATVHAHPCPCCGGRMIIIELLEPGCQTQHQPLNAKIRMDTS
jgi:putative transposase